MILSLSFLKGFVEICVANCPVDHRKLHCSSKNEEKWQKPEIKIQKKEKSFTGKGRAQQKSIEDIK
jgi:hypothetical protein